MIKRVKMIFLLSIFLFTALANYAQETEEQKDSPFSVGADFVSRYIWRGVNLGGSSPSVQPYLDYTISLSDHSISIGAWGAYSLSGATTGQEADLYLSYTFKDMISLTVTDYFFPDETVSRNQYFNYNMDWDKIDNGEKDQTGHVVELALSFNGTENIPVSLLFAMNIWGADSRKYIDVNGLMTPQDQIVMSKYLELGYSAEIRGVALDIFTGFTFHNPEITKGEPVGFYGQESAGMINLGLTLSNEIRITENYSLPVFGSLITNPEAENIFLVFGISF